MPTRPPSRAPAFPARSLVVGTTPLHLSTSRVSGAFPPGAYVVTRRFSAAQPRIPLVTELLGLRVAGRRHRGSRQGVGAHRHVQLGPADAAVTAAADVVEQLPRRPGRDVFARGYLVLLGH